jgi:hypothetical protein
VAYASCPTAIINAPVEIVWSILTDPQGWSDFFDVRSVSVQPPGSAAVGQTISAASGPRVLRLKLKIRFAEVDPAKYFLGLDVQLPFGITVREELSCVRLDQDKCRVTYNCDFHFPAGWRGVVVQSLVRNRLDIGPVDSLSRLQGIAEQRYRRS